MVTITLSFKPRQVTKHLVSPLAPRAREVILERFGLQDDAEPKTLEAIGEIYGITRERVRQIEQSALQAVRKSAAFKEEEEAFRELKQAIIRLGAVLAEEDLLEELAKDEATKNHILFFLALHDDFVHHKESDHFKHRWSVDPTVADCVHDALTQVYDALKDDGIVTEEEMLGIFLEHLKHLDNRYKDEEILKRWLSLSKTVSRNPLGEWGRSHAAGVKVRGVRDYAFLVLRRHGRPMHFRDIAEAIQTMFGKDAHVATTHNELIKDPRFVLVGRGLYALKDWGYSQGAVRDVIKDVLKKSGPLSKEDIVKKVLERRFVKENTITVNLQNPSFFKRSKDGLYTLAK